MARAPIPADPNSHPVRLPGERPDPRQLHEATDRLNKALTRLEEELVALKLGVSARITLDEDNETDWVQYFSFKKISGSFKLVIESGQDGFPDSFNTTPITSVSRETRLRAVEHFPALYEALIKEFDDEVTRVNESISRLEELRQALRTKAGK